MNIVQNKQGRVRVLVQYPGIHCPIAKEVETTYTRIDGSGDVDILAILTDGTVILSDHEYDDGKYIQTIWKPYGYVNLN